MVLSGLKQIILAFKTGYFWQGLFMLHERKAQNTLQVFGYINIVSKQGNQTIKKHGTNMLPQQ